MKRLLTSVSLAVVLLTLGAANVLAQIATVDVANPTNVTVTYDGGPYIFAPNTPEEPTNLYTDDVLLPPVTTDSTTLLYVALIDSGILQGTAGNLDGDYVSQAPAVITSDPDTYTTDSPPTIYYTAPTNDPPVVFTTNCGPFNFDFGPGAVAPGYAQVLQSTAYNPSLGYGWGDTSKVSSRVRAISDPLESDFCMPNGTPFYLDLSNGTYVVSVLSGDASQKSGMAVRGNGLLELYNVAAPSGQFLEQSFPIVITNGRLRLEFQGSICHVNAISVTRVPDDQPHKPTIFVASDSTSAAYTQYQYPMTGWGDRLSWYFDDQVVVDDQAKAGRSVKSFIEEGGLWTIINRMQTNDYLFIMSAINDSASTGNRKTDPSSVYKAYLRVFVNAAREHGGIPVFVTSQTKRTYDLWGRFYNSVGAYPQSMRDFGKELNVPVIDLSQMSIDYFTAVGVDETTNIFMFLPPGKYPAWPNGDADYIHFQDNGATKLAGLIVEGFNGTSGVRQMNFPGISEHVLSSPPAAPASVTATADSSTSINLEWTSSYTARVYNVKRAASNGGPFTTIASNVAGTAYADTNLAPGTTYYYVVSAVNIIGESSDSPQAFATTLAGPSATPSGIVAAPGDQQVVLSWNVSPGATSYNVKRSNTAGGPYTTIASPTSNTYTDSGLANGTTYYYVLSSVNTYGESADSAEISAKPVNLVDYWPFDESSGTTAADVIGGNPATLADGAAWIAGKINNAVYLNGSSNNFVSFPAGFISTLTDFTVASWVKLDSAPMWSRIFDFGSGSSAYMFLTPYSGSKNLRFAITVGGGATEQQINAASALSTGVWHHVAVTLAGRTGILYVDGVEVGRNSGMTITPSSLGNTTQNYLGKSQYAADPNLPGAVDELRIYGRALNASELASLAVLPNIPSGLTATAGNAQAILQWNTAWAANGYDLKRATTSGGPYSTVGTNLTTTSYTDSGLVNGTTYYYVVSAENSLGESSNSSEVSVTPMPPGVVYLGRATALSTTVLGATNAWSDTGALPPSGGAQQSSLLAISQPNVLAADVAHASSIGQGDRTRSESAAADVVLNVSGITIQADFTMARATAIWQATGTALSGSANVSSLLVNGTPILVSGQPNQMVPLAGGYLVINQQTNTATTITVNALHLLVSGVADVVVSSAQAGIASVLPPTCGGSDYVSGAGWITTALGNKAHFGLEGGITNSTYFGHVTYKDNGTGLTVQSTGITKYQVGPTANSRHIEGNATVNGSAGYTFAVDVTDNGNPGSSDTFSISLSNGYRASGTLGGGNIQLHDPCE